MGLNLTQAAMMEGKHVTYLPSYGAEVRGGTANCTVAVSNEEIASPVASSPEFVIAMNLPSLVRFQNQIESGGVLLFDASLVETEVSRGDIEVVGIPATDLANKIGSPKSANMVMLGAFIKKSNLVSLDSVIEGLKSTFKGKPDLVTINEQALRTGYDLL